MNKTFSYFMGIAIIILLIIPICRIGVVYDCVERCYRIDENCYIKVISFPGPVRYVVFSTNERECINSSLKRRALFCAGNPCIHFYYDIKESLIYINSANYKSFKAFKFKEMEELEPGAVMDIFLGNRKNKIEITEGDVNEEIEPFWVHYRKRRLMIYRKI